MEFVLYFSSFGHQSPELWVQRFEPSAQFPQCVSCYCCCSMLGVGIGGQPCATPLHPPLLGGHTFLIPVKEFLVMVREFEDFDF